jgi:hypothetical protein
VQPPLLSEILPRMDVAVFIGFAASGPLHIPVAIEDIGHFEALFGRDVPLAWDSERGETVYAYLAPAVRAFLGNGGRRAWIVRVAGLPATANSFKLSSLVQFDEHLNQSPAVFLARSEGSWSDTLTVGAVLTSEILSLAPRAAFSSPPEFGKVALTPAALSSIGRGDLLRVSFLDSQLVLLLAVNQPPQGTVLDLTSGTAFWYGASHPESPVSLPHLESSVSEPTLPGIVIGVERLTFTLEVRDGEQAAWQLPNLGFAPGHPRYWGDLPTDADLYNPIPSDPTKPPPNLWAVAAEPRFPLAARPGTSGIYFPLAMPSFGGMYTAPEEQTATALARDGLSEFDARLFFDMHDPGPLQTLVEATSADLLNEADYQRYQGSEPRTLGGLYAALDVDEATLIAIPDAVHRGWLPTSVQDPASPVESSPLDHPEWWHFLPCNPPAVPPKVRQPDRSHFLDCNLVVLDAPVLHVTDQVDQADTYTLSWTEVAGASYILEEDIAPGFTEAAIISQGSATQFPIHGRAPGDYYYRVRAVSGNVSSNYSNGVGVRVAPARGYILTSVADSSPESLLLVQRSLLRLCATRGDLFAVLSLPEHYHDSDAITHVNLLMSATQADVVPASPLSPVLTSLPLGYAEAAAFSYGALYYPWLMSVDESDPSTIRRTPPDGAACGILARRALARGAWIAPANEPLNGVVALMPDISRDTWQDLQDAQINLFRQEPHGFVVLSADTLSQDPDLRPINVRRLLILLRRLALRLGANYVFEPNDDAFRRSVQRGFETQLEYLFKRGAFAGRTANTAFQVVTDSTVNTPQSLDQGRFVVELRVAPSLPMSFLTIRLVQTGERGLVTEVS